MLRRSEALTLWLWRDLKDATLRHQTQKVWDSTDRKYPGQGNPEMESGVVSFLLIFIYLKRREREKERSFILYFNSPKARNIQGRARQN